MLVGVADPQKSPRFDFGGADSDVMLDLIERVRTSVPDTEIVYQWSNTGPISDREGATIFLCHEHHQGRTGVHSDTRFDAWLKRDCQRRWMEREHATADDFREVFYASYVDEE